jgi:hypothetical protein
MAIRSERTVQYFSASMSNVHVHAMTIYCFFCNNKHTSVTEPHHYYAAPAAPDLTPIQYSLSYGIYLG